MKIDKICIVFGDNDFYNTFYCVLNTILTSVDYSGSIDLTKEQLCEIINSLSYGHYRLFQNRFSYNPLETNKFLENYLRINPTKISNKQPSWSQFQPYLLLNEEVEEFILTYDNWNGECFFLYIEEKLIFSR